MKQARTFYDVIKILEKQGLYLVRETKSKWFNRRRTILVFEYDNIAGSKIKPDLAQLQKFDCETYRFKNHPEYYKGLLVSHK